MKIIFTDEQKNKIESALLEMLPHGSGINSKWEFNWLKSQSVICSNSFHCMNEHGFYDGYADFSVKIHPLKALTAFGLVFNGRQAQNKNRQYQLRDYLEDEMYHAMSGDKSLLSLSRV